MRHVLNLLFIYFVLSISAASWNYEEPLNIQGGQIDTTENKPYMVSICSGIVRLKCGGTIISPNYAVSAKHCLRTRTPSAVIVRAGSSKWREGGTVHKIIEYWIPHDEDNDIAILKIDPPFTFNQHCGPIALPSAAYRLEVGVFGEVSGWGDTIWQVDSPSDQLRSVQLPVISRTICSQWMLNSRPLYPDEFCASYMNSSREEGFGHGDSGGPFVVNNKLIGVVHRRKGQGVAGRTSGQIFTSIPYHRLWIRRVTGI